MKKLFTLGIGVILMCALSTVALAATDYTVNSSESESATNYTDVALALVDAVSGDTVTITSSANLNSTAEIKTGVTLTINNDVTLTIINSATLTNNGTIINNGTITNNGIILNNGDITGSGDITGGGCIVDENGEVGALDFSSVTADVTNDYYDWDYENLTLTIPEAGLEISTQDTNGLILPDGATIVLDGGLDISTDGFDAINAQGALTISGSGDLSAVTIGADGDLIIEDTVRVIGYSVYSDAGDIYIKDTATVFVTYYIYNNTVDKVIDVASTATVNGLVCTRNSTTYYDYVVYGEMNVSVDNNNIFYYDALAFTSGSKLTVYADISIDWTGFTTIDWTNANISNYGTIILPDATVYNDVSWSSISGTGYVLIGDTAYDCSGATTVAPYYGTLTLSATEAFDDEELYGFTWTQSNGDGDYDTLTITDLTIIASDGDGLVLPAGTTIILDGDLNITATGDGIACAGNLNITGRGNLNITADSDGIYVYGDGATANLTVVTSGDMSITAGDNGIYAYSSNEANVAITATGDITITAEYSGIHVLYDLTMDTDGDVTITSTNGHDGRAIWSEHGDLDLDFGGTVVITSEYGIEVDTGDLEMNVAGSLTIYATAFSIYASEGISLTGTGTITSDAQMCTTGVGSIATTLTVTGWMQYRDYTGTDRYCDIYGDVVLAYRSYHYSAYGTITFVDGASITIEAGATLDLSSYFVRIVDMNIVNNGILILSDYDYDAEDLAALGIEGSGMIALYDDDSGKCTYYDNQGNLLTVLTDDIYLTAATLEDGEGYTWVLENGTYTLTFDDDVVAMVDTAIYIQVTAPVIFNVANDITVDYVYFGMDDSYNDASYDLTISGDGTLTCASLESDDETGKLSIKSDVIVLEYIFMMGDLTIDGNVTANQGIDMMGDLTINGDVTAAQGVVLQGDLIVNGNLTTGMVYIIGDMTVNNGATVTLTGYSMEGIEVALMMMNITTPILTLGDEIAILTPADGAFTIVLGDVYMGTITTDGAAPEVNYSNWATYIVIGEKPVSSSSSSGGSSSYSSSVSSASNGDVSISSAKSSSGTTVTITATPDDGYVVGSVTVTYASGKEVTVTDNGDGTYSYIQPGAAVTVTVTFVDPDAVEETVVVDEASGFIDVDPDAYYYDAMLWAVENGITTGYADDTFRATTSCTRGQVVTFLWRAAGCPVVTADAASMALIDADPDSYYYQAMVWAVENGIVAGYGDGTFRAGDTCTRSQIVTFLWRMAGEPDWDICYPYADVDADAWYVDAVYWATVNGIATGYGDETFRGSTLCNRGQIVTFLYRYLGE